MLIFRKRLLSLGVPFTAMLLCLPSGAAATSHEQIVTDLLHQLESAEPDDRPRLIRELGDLGPGAKAVPALVATLSDPSEHVHRAAFDRA